MTNVIPYFTGRYRFLSNFYPSPVTYQGIQYKTVEHAYQAAKTTDPFQRTMIQNALSAGSAKNFGRRVTMRPNWEEIKVLTMLDLLRKKFGDPELHKKLLETGSATLVEGNSWNDVFWGVCDGKGNNTLGKLLMVVRDEGKDPVLHNYSIAFPVRGELFK